MIGSLGVARYVLAVMLACMAVSLFAPAARADCPPNALEVLGICYPCEYPRVLNDTKSACICPSPTTDPNFHYGAGASSTFVNGCLLCGPGSVVNAAGTGCTAVPFPPPPKCGPSMHVSTQGCPADQYYCCQSCPAGQTWYPGYNYCDICPSGLGQAPNPDQSADDPCVTCGGATIATAQACVACTGNKIPNGKHSECVSCTNGFVANAAHTHCVCPAGTVSTSSVYNPNPAKCVRCPPNQIPNATQTACSPCPAGTVAQFGSCVKYQASPSPVVPGTPKKPSPPRSTIDPGLLESTPGLGPQGPAAVGTPRGGGGSRR